MAELCRLCAAVRKRDLLSAITVDICEKLKECFAIEICELGNDELPRCACGSCIADLQIAYTFYKRIKDSQESLTLLYNCAKDKSNDKASEECESLNENNTEERGCGEDGCNEIVIHDLEKTTNINCDPFETNRHSMQLRVGTELKEGSHETEDSVVLYEFMLSDAEEEETEYECMELEDVLDDTANIKNEQTDNSVEVKIEAYMLEEEDEDENEVTTHETKEFVEPYNKIAKTDADVNTKDTSKPMQVEIMPVINDSAVDLNSHETPTLDKKIQILEWKSYTWICHVCSKACISFPSLLAHAKEVHLVANMTSLQYECTDCQKVCRNYNKFLNHVRFRHHFDLKLRCDACDLQQDNYKQLAKHREMCSEAAVLYPLVDICEICGKNFPNQNATSKHACALHKNDEVESDVTIKGHQCSHCKKSFKQVAYLRAHEQIHSNSKEFACEICDRKFHQKQALKLHFYSHIDDKVYECKICKKNFKTTMSLEKHHQIHKEIKKFSCAFCKKDFRTKDEKTSHERIHTGEKPFRCTYCDRSFRFRSGLMCHINTHTGEHPYSCSDCGRSFTNWGNMNKHSRRCRNRKNDENGTVT